MSENNIETCLYPLNTTHFLLRYLYLKTRELDEFAVVESDIMADLDSIKKLASDKGYTIDDSEILLDLTTNLEANFKLLEERGFANRHSSVPTLVFSYLGFFFAEQFDSPPILEDFFSNSQKLATNPSA